MQPRRASLNSMSNPQLTVVTVTFNNTVDELERFALGFMAARREARRFGLDVRLLYVDNGDDSGLNLRCEEVDASVCARRLATCAVASQSGLIDRGDRNVGYGPAMHQLWQAAFGDGCSAVITANPDGTFHPDCIVRLHEMSARRPGHLYEARQFPSEHPKIYDPTHGWTDWASGCCIYVGRELFERVGNLDAGFWLYMEDVDYSWRVRAASRRVVMCPFALYAHDTADRVISERARLEMYKAGRRLAWKWQSPRFQLRCETVLRNQFNLRELPILGAPPTLTHLEASVADFSHAFTFTGQRWAF